MTTFCVKQLIIYIYICACASCVFGLVLAHVCTDIGAPSSLVSRAPNIHM